MVRQGDIILIDFGPVIGHEEDKYRPGLVVSNDDYNDYCGGIVLVCPISHSKDFPLHIDLPEGLKTDGKVLCEHIRSLDINAGKYKYVETVPGFFTDTISDILKACVDVNVKASDV
ncbi:MAG: type II toxin-antitoxin system PemK/MazF family toxin [Lachnospiraceae bacterium]|nr:type II toxin-antitoxin system PemK/MazF family toxin [Lachnospiraceae bacterium]